MAGKAKKKLRKYTRRETQTDKSNNSLLDKNQKKKQTNPHKQTKNPTKTTTPQNPKMLFFSLFFFLPVFSKGYD